MGKGACRADRAGGIRVRPAKISSAVKVAGGDHCKAAKLAVLTHVCHLTSGHCLSSVIPRCISCLAEMEPWQRPAHRECNLVPALPDAPVEARPPSLPLFPPTIFGIPRVSGFFVQPRCLLSPPPPPPSTPFFSLSYSVCRRLSPCV